MDNITEVIKAPHDTTKLCDFQLAVELLVDKKEDRDIFLRMVQDRNIYRALKDNEPLNEKVCSTLTAITHLAHYRRTREEVELLNDDELKFIKECFKNPYLSTKQTISIIKDLETMSLEDVKNLILIVKSLDMVSIEEANKNVAIGFGVDTKDGMPVTYDDTTQKLDESEMPVTYYEGDTNVPRRVQIAFFLSQIQHFDPNISKWSDLAKEFCRMNSENGLYNTATQNMIELVFKDCKDTITTDNLYDLAAIVNAGTKLPLEAQREMYEAVKNGDSIMNCAIRYSVAQELNEAYNNLDKVPNKETTEPKKDMSAYTNFSH
jgi:hypothetical protein